MKFMKLGSKPDCLQTDGNTVRYVAAELATDIMVNVGDVKFYLHKFPLLSKSAHLQKLVATINEENDSEIFIPDIPGGPAAFEVCAKFCYGMTVTLNAYNVVAVHCAAEYLGMHETVEKGNLIFKIEVFLNSSVFRNWKDSIIVLQTTKSLLPWCKDLNLTTHCIDSIVSMASIDPSMVKWSYTYNRKKYVTENGIDSDWNGVKKQQLVPKDWWVEDLCELEIDFYNRIITAIKTKRRICAKVIGEALKAYTLRRLPGFSKGAVRGGEVLKNRSLLETIIWLLPKEDGSVPCGFLLKLLKAATFLGSSETTKKDLVKSIGRQLEEASLADLFIPAAVGESILYDVNLVQSIVEEFLMQDHGSQSGPPVARELLEIRNPGFGSSAAKLAVARLVDGYLAEIAKDPNLPHSMFVDLAKLVSIISRPAHDGLYRAIDMYLKEHPGLSKSEKKRVCGLMDCKKLSTDACMHAVQNDRLPLRVVVQVLFFEQVKAATSSTTSGPNLPESIQAILPQENGGSHGSSQSATTNTEEDWDANPTPEELKSPKDGLVGGLDRTEKINDKGSGRVRGAATSKKIFNRLWSSKGQRDYSCSDTSGSIGSLNPDETKSTPPRNRRKSVS